MRPRTVRHHDLHLTVEDADDGTTILDNEGEVLIHLPGQPCTPISDEWAVAIARAIDTAITLGREIGEASRARKILGLLLDPEERAALHTITRAGLGDVAGRDLRKALNL